MDRGLWRLNLQTGCYFNVLYIQLCITFRHNKGVSSSIYIIHLHHFSCLIQKGRCFHPAGHIGIHHHLIPVFSSVFRCCCHCHNRTRHNSCPVILINRPTVRVAGSRNSCQLRHIRIISSIVIFGVDSGNRYQTTLHRFSHITWSKMIYFKGYSIGIVCCRKFSPQFLRHNVADPIL